MTCDKSKNECSSCKENYVAKNEYYQSINKSSRKRILIICTGNSCRSQMAEGWLNSFDERLDVFSAGTRPEKTINPYAVKVMAEVGVDISFHYPKAVDNFVNEQFDYIITVCDNANKICPEFHYTTNKRMHISIEDPADATGTDEYITHVYRKIRDQLRDKFYKFYTDLS